MKRKHLYLLLMTLLAFAGSILLGNVLEPGAFEVLGFHVIMSTLLVFGMLYIALTSALFFTLFLRRRWRIDDLFHLLVAGGYVLLGILLVFTTDAYTKGIGVLIVFCMTMFAQFLELTRKPRRIKRVRKRLIKH